MRRLATQAMAATVKYHRTLSTPASKRLLRAPTRRPLSPIKAPRIPSTSAHQQRASAHRVRPRLQGDSEDPNSVTRTVIPFLPPSFPLLATIRGEEIHVGLGVSIEGRTHMGELT
jgi:hypothetical protein